MSDPIPKELALGSLDMSLRELLVHMTERHLDHTVLVISGTPVRVSITVASVQKTDLITKAVQRILTP
jgi:hypothetical protein